MAPQSPTELEFELNTAPSSPTQLAYGLDDELEDAPLLNSEERPDDDAASISDSLHSHPDRHYRFNRWGIRSPRRIVLLLAFVKFLIVLSGMLLLVPYARLLEDLFCHAYYNDPSSDIIEEMKCKVDEIQSRMVFFFGWSGLVSSVLGLIIAFPYGMLADKIGRKPTIIFAYSGVAFSFGIGPFFLKQLLHQVRDNPYWLLAGAVFQIFGGGIPVLLSTTYAMAADVSTEENKATHFLYLTFGTTAGGILGPVCAGLLMQRYGPWLPIYLVGLTVPIVFSILLLLPETLSIKIKNQQGPESKTFKSHMRQGLKDLRQSLRILKNKSVPLVLVTFFIQSARFSAASTTMSQYISKHFGWRLAEISILLSPLGILNLVILAGLPKVSEILLSPRFRMTPFTKDLFLTRISTSILVVGALVEGFSHNVVLFLIGLFITTFGAADSPLARATVSHYVQPEYTSRLYALITMVEVLGSFIGGPVLAWCFDRGLKRKGIWIGLPWFYVAFLCSLAWVALLFVKPPKKHAQEDGVYSDGDDTDDSMPDDPLRLD
ncbi:major facilitator superfamily domain-containing protein [Dactylonectria estremocensis]|uniref:Major facilitator superfamily domain-containing protein n=1 Tax=Dactylonectria estremocensis TaxID=1079267 RepID=A0A9P9F4M0_9HYPO|nr:major facilitator superfamily domain-containing protein [Dactylonectria estremocensis]